MQTFTIVLKVQLTVISYILTVIDQYMKIIVIFQIVNTCYRAEKYK